MLPTCKVAGKVIFAFALVATNVALERVLVAMAAHVDGVEDVVGVIDVTVLAVMQHVWVLKWSGLDRGWCAGLAVGNTGSAGVLAAWPTTRTAATVWRGPGLWGDRRRRGCVGHAGCDSYGGSGWVWLLYEERLFIHNRLCSWRHGGLGLCLGL